ncbi:type II toxin-antitoxin system HipA family toxin [Salinispira pacifica]|uniref:HIPA Protein n=1 Tax=Salinispira pacifica TaxID=1307761 RepID=V5WJK0_9SPIO|nr:type II toxin-antitoxin system HipA family toxin [Salinispira pacifica]AHC15997.1 HIPA Protein [Salinispira pacifica]
MRGTVDVQLWGTKVGSLGYAPGQTRIATFEYEPEFMESRIQIAPVHLTYPPARFSFSGIGFNSFQGVPGFIADSLPDKFGSQLIDIYMAEKNIPASEVTTLDRLSYIADRGMGALEYKPGETLPLQRSALDVQQLSELAERVQQRQSTLHGNLLSTDDRAAALTMIRIGSSAGGARSKALVAKSRTGKLLDGTVNHGPHYTYWLLKFDSSSNQDKEGADPRGMPVLEYIYSLIARKAGIEMPRTELIDDSKDRHFLIERFDRIIRNGTLDKLHYVSWAGLDHADRDGTHSYEQLILLIRKLKLGHGAETEIFRRAVFNVIGRNQDDHTKNTGFLMDRSGKWRLSPAFDLTYAYDPGGKFTRNHQCRLNRKNHDFLYEDLLQFGRYCNLSERKSREIIGRVGEAFSRFHQLARDYQLSGNLRDTVESNLRLGLLLKKG